MQTREGLCPVRDFIEGRLGSVTGAMLGWLHGLLLSSAVSEVRRHIPRVSQMKEKIIKLFHDSKAGECSANKCNCSVPTGSKREEWSGFRVTSEQSARRVSSSTIDGLRSRLRSGLLCTRVVNSAG
jgi:hypothetical protein